MICISMLQSENPSSTKRLMIRNDKNKIKECWRIDLTKAALKSPNWANLNLTCDIKHHCITFGHLNTLDRQKLLKMHQYTCLNLLQTCISKN